MNPQIATTEKICPRQDIAAYIDGELTPREELALEAHFANCPDCLSELNLQKQMLCALDFGLEPQAEIELPKNFAKVVATRAESGVCGLRSKEERFRALFLSALLFLIVLVGLGAETGNLLSTSGKFLEKGIAVASFFGHLVFDLAFGITIILRSLSSQFVFSSLMSFVAVAFFFALSVLTLSHLISRYRQPKKI